ncbi:MAG: DinB family protein, partial [Chloroflexi bacterium]|nr:DinB family protein [Chloroflexota bacterium]
GHTQEQVADFPALDLTELLRYGAAVRAGTLDYLGGLQPEDFEVIPRERRPDFSVATMFRQIIGELYQHTGQIAYVKGLTRGSNTFSSNYTAPA